MTRRLQGASGQAQNKQEVRALENKRIIEINGVKLEVDLSTAKKVDEFRIGDKVKVLKKEYGDNYKVFAGVIIGFEDFKSLPTITVAYLETGYTSADIKFLYFNDKTEGAEIAYAANDEIPFELSTIVEQMDKLILQKQTEWEEAMRKKEYFLSNFTAYFSDFANKYVEGDVNI